MKKIRIILITEIALIICLIIAVTVVTITKNNSSKNTAQGTDASSSSENEIGKNDLTSDEKLRYNELIYRVNTLMFTDAGSEVRLSESGEQRLNFVIYAYSMKVEHNYEDNIRSIAYIPLAELKTDYEALYGPNYNFDQDYESASESITKPCPSNIAAEGIICFRTNVDFSYSYSFNPPVITGQDGTYQMTGTYQKIDNSTNESIDLKYSADFKNSYLLDFVAPAES